MQLVFQMLVFLTCLLIGYQKPQAPCRRQSWSRVQFLTMNVFHPMDHPLLCQFKCSRTWAKERKAVRPLRLSDRKQKAPHSSKGCTRECRWTAEYNVSLTSVSSSRIIQQQYCQNLGFHQLSTAFTIYVLLIL